MGKAAGQTSQAPPPYSDEPEAADDLSMHTTRSDYEYDDVPDLPPYSDGEPEAGQGPEPRPIARQPDIYQVIREPLAPSRVWKRKSNATTPAAAVGSETSIRMDQRLEDGRTLFEYVERYIRHVPPNPLVRIQGWHWETRHKDNKKEQQRIFDFDIVMSMQKYFPSSSPPKWSSARVVGNSDKAYRGSCLKKRAPGYKQDIEVGNEANTPTLEDWCKDYCDSRAGLKIFRITRHIAGLETEAMHASLTQIVRSTNYRGHIDISFPIADKNIDIYSPHWVNSMRISWVRWIFYLTFLWILTWPILFLLTKRWDVYNIVWVTSYCETTGETVTRRERLSARQWVQTHGNLIKSLVWERFQGDATDMPTDVDPEARRNGRMPSSGNNHVDTAVRLVQGGVDVWNTMNNRGGVGWGMDG